ncbi:MAG: hypothetical protein ACTII7_09650 [Galactobacter sp.]
MMKELIRSLEMAVMVVAGWVHGVPAWLDAQARRWRSKAQAGEGPVALILIILGVIAIVAIVVVAVRSYVTRKTNELG